MDYVAELWQRYRNKNDRQAREELILNYTRLVRYVVGRLAIGLPASLQHEDLVGFGILGLIEAVDRFNPDQGVKFATYAVTRIRGQIIDSLRAMDLLPRSVYRHNRDIEQAMATLTQGLGRSPTNEEVAEFLNISLDQYHGWLADINFSMISLDQVLVYDNGEESNLYGSLEDTNIPSPSQQIDDSEMKTELVAAIHKLPEREQLMISLYYNDGLTMKEIGQVLDVSESRVSQIHARAMLTLRSFINSRTEPNPIVYHRREKHASVFATAG